MFISYEYKSHYEKDGEYTWEYEITDSEFGTSSGAVSIEKVAAYIIEIAIAVIQEYSKRNLNVAANLILSFAWLHRQHPFLPIQKLIDWNKADNPFFLPYEKDLQKYLVLL
jgi:hypothetical protein